MVSVFCIALQTGQAFSQKVNTCQPHTICAHPGDILQYSMTLRDTNSSEIYNFASMTDVNNIKLVQSQADNSRVQNTTWILNLKTGFVHSEQDSSIAKPFLEILTSPIDYSKSDTSVTQIVTEFNGIKRTALVAFHSSENTTSKIVYDIETGILLDEHSTSIVTIRGNPELVDFSDKLVYTNMINSDSDSIKVLKGNVSIPKWVKNTSRFWSQDQIQDAEFVKAMQYLISNGMMQIPHNLSGVTTLQPIPTWVKHSAGWWAEGQVSDDEFVKNIQWLITKGIIQVGN